MEKTLTQSAGTGPAGQYQKLFETPSYAVIKTLLPKQNNESGLAVFAVVDKTHGIIYGARSGYGQAVVLCGVAEMELAEGLQVAAAQKARGYKLPDTPVLPDGNGSNPFGNLNG